MVYHTMLVEDLPQTLGATSKYQQARAEMKKKHGKTSTHTAMSTSYRMTKIKARNKE